jgi:uncharacterized ferritin-like protein (DUF455 family)
MFKRRKAPALVPYDMFDAVRVGREAEAARSLERVYHAGQSKAWDGRALLAELVEKHGGVNLAPDKLQALQKILAVIFWGELAAWKVSADLALRIEPLEAKMAATSQAHDEARHFYVLHDYLALLGYTPGPLPVAASGILDKILSADHLAKKLVGMQLMVEPIALTLFQMIRRHQTEPVLCELLRYYERDEARHIALGVNYLPELLKEMSPVETVDYWRWELGMIRLEVDGMLELEAEFRVLGFPPAEVFRLGQAKQLLAARMLADRMGDDGRVTDVFRRISQAMVEYHFPTDGKRRLMPRRLLHALRATRDPGTMDEALTEAA